MNSSSMTSTSLQKQSLFRIPMARSFMTVVFSTVLLLVVCKVFAPSSVSWGALSGSLPFAAIIAVVGLGQLLVVQQGGFDLSLPGSVSLAVVVATHYPQQNDALLYQAVLIALGMALIAGFANGILVSFFRLNSIIATIGVNALLYGAVFATSGGVPSITTNLLAEIAGGETFRVPNAVYFALAATVVVSFVLKKTLVGRRFEAIGASPPAGRAAGLRVRVHQMMAYVFAQLLYCTAGILIAGITREPTAFQGDTLLLPSVAVVVLGGTSLLGGRGFPISTVIAAFFLNQLSQFALSVGVPYSAQTIIQALALGFGIGVYSLRWRRNVRKTT
ncbi:MULTISPECIES: ABC transporter permease [unclassified Rhizobium]|uniref:ABC transporter permease n=1 Tax=unclassified Rhizobium TaxID=2613769 RepID=UPI001ADC74CC|nr:MULTISPECIES: ABC transporter permease [unclassified Rhizobium]MBO9101663.1 ABC transporter permease [Rhizobium sp. L58/93]QXZ86567.1 ABC transporter permease [Rhizobium sp. K1/93]QXZ93400.1 ABC transporter permease [Rhizobium sp. K15/93]QYA04766.1 ABC transporter permease [Rhizobium sp. B21/90]